MRSDFAKCLVERERTGGDGGKSIPRKGYKKKLQKALVSDNYDGLIKKEYPRKKLYDYKRFNENLSILRRWLDKQVGRPWNDIYSELRSNLSADSVIQSHVLDHVKWEVEQNVNEIAGRVYDSKSTRELHDKQFYVGKSGLLLKYKYKTRRKKEKKPIVTVWFGDEKVATKVNGIWYMLTMKPLPPIKETMEPHKSIYSKSTLYLPHKYWTKCFYDVFLKISGRVWFSDVKTQLGQLRKCYGKETHYCISKLQMNSKEIKQMLKDIK